MTTYWIPADEMIGLECYLSEHALPTSEHGLGEGVVVLVPVVAGISTPTWAPSTFNCPKCKAELKVT